RDRIRVDDIAGHDDGARGLCGPARLDTLAVPHRDARAGLQHALRDGEANAAGTARDGGDFAGEVDLIHGPCYLVCAVRSTAASRAQASSASSAYSNTSHSVRSIIPASISASKLMTD